MLNFFKNFLFLVPIIGYVAGASSSEPAKAKFVRCERGGKVTDITKKLKSAFTALIIDKGVAYFGKEDTSYSFTREAPGTMFGCRKSEKVDAVTCERTGDVRVDLQSISSNPSRGINIQAQHKENTVGGLILIHSKEYSVKEITDNLISSIDQAALLCDEDVVKAEDKKPIEEKARRKSKSGKSENYI